MKLVIIVFFGFLVFISAQAAKTKKSSSTNGEEFDSNVNESCEALFNQTAIHIEPVLLINRDVFPTSIDAVNKHCDLGATVYKSMRKYGKCLQGLGRQALSVFLHGLKKFIRSICLSTQKKEEAIRDLKCATNVTLLGWNKCLNIANRQLDFVADNSSGPSMVGNVCCVYSSVLDCIDQHTGTLPGCDKNADTTKFFRKSIAFVLKEVIELICSKYSSAEECRINNPRGLAALKVIAETPKPVDGAFLISPLLKVVLKLGSDGDDV